MRFARVITLAAALVLLVSSAWAQDVVRDGQPINPRTTGPSPTRLVARSVASATSPAGAIDSVVTVAIPGRLPQLQVVGGVVRSDTSGKALSLTSSGALINDDASRDRDFRIWTTPSTDTVSTFTADSTVSGPFYTAQMARMWLRVQVRWPNSADAATNLKSCSFAVQVRAHLTAQTDSLNTNPWWAYSDTTRTISMPNTTTGTYRMVADSTNQHSVWQTKGLPTEMVFFATRGQVRGSASAIAPFQMPEYDGEPANFWIPLADLRGVYFWAPYTSIRIRTLSNNSGAAPQYVVDLVGTAR